MGVAGGGSTSQSRNGSHERPAEFSDTSDTDAPSVRRMNEQPTTARPTDSYDPNRFRLHFERESREEIERRKRVSREHVLKLISEKELEVDVDEIYQPGSVLDFPRRPSWSYNMSREALWAREERSFEKYLKEVHDTFPSVQLSYFEHNLETWRQLWRVLEMSDIILLITDIRHPVVHFSPALYTYVTQELSRGLILVLNKIDLVPAPIVSAWKAFFQEKFPGVHVVCFTSFPHEVLDDPNPRDALQKRRRWRGWSMAVGPRQLITACEAIVQGQVDLTSWREKMERDAVSSHLADDDDEDDKEEDVHMEVQSDATLEPPSAELYHDGIVTIGCIGFPNVGKSSLINGLVGKKVVSISRTPGHTKYFQTYFLTPTLKLCDCPGLIFPSLIGKPQQIMAGIYPIAQLQEPYTVVGYLAERVPIQTLLHLKHPEDEAADPSWTAWDICEAWAEKRGYKTARAARNDCHRAANSLLRLALDGRLCVYTLPPGYTDNKAFWEHHPETMALERLLQDQKKGRVHTGEAGDNCGIAKSSGPLSSDDDEIELSSSECADDKSNDADEEEDGEEESGGQRLHFKRVAVSSKPCVRTRNAFAVLGEDDA
uniref:guanine nucleotide-binding protein-like 1 n=1 Tax=Myxine glutinosa TaxID=7769 RepID=UPI00358F01C5